ncbi:MAG: ribosome recycling factor [Actinobacteria bacterium]|nr:ribosome recycling factor [Actinomycetota bacterium]
MSPDQIVNQANKKFQDAVSFFEEDLKKVRTGRAHPGMLEGIVVQAITPFDPNNLEPIVKAIREQQNLGLNPMDDGKLVRVPIPALNEERRREYTKLVSSKLEDCMVSMRTVRHEAMKTIDEAKKDKDIGEDEAKRLSEKIDSQMADAKKDAEELAKQKETEIMTV